MERGITIKESTMNTNTNRITDRSKTVLNETIVLSDEALDHVVGGQKPDGTAGGNRTPDMASPKFSWGVGRGIS
jgi:hypothetical protein